MAVEGFRDHLLEELGATALNPGPDIRLYGDLVHYARPTAPQTFWQKTILSAPFIAQFDSVSEAADILRSLQRNWAYHPTACFRRAALVQERLPYMNLKPRPFPWQIPDSPIGLWTLLDEHTLFASAASSSPFPAGEISFEEDHINPPSRAYLKMYEILTILPWILRKRGFSEGEIAALVPQAGTVCVDAGASPGGWTWVLDRIGATITAIDKGDLDERLLAKGNISFKRHDAFTLKPAELGRQDWVFSDVICYPPRLLEWVRQWLDSGLCDNFVCTIKMQGPADHETTRAFAAIPGSHIMHLSANKHELTWFRTPERALPQL